MTPVFILCASSVSEHMMAIGGSSFDVESRLQHVLYILRNNYLSYTAVWEHSVVLCSLSHSGEPPCFLPLDFCENVPVRSAVDMDMTLKDNCPAIEVYNLYHSLRINNFQGTLLNVSSRDEDFHRMLVEERVLSPITRKTEYLFDNPWKGGPAFSQREWGPIRTSSTAEAMKSHINQDSSSVLESPLSLPNIGYLTLGSNTSLENSSQSREKDLSSFFKNKGHCDWDFSLVDEFVCYLVNFIELLDVAI